jgi:PPP family 3-phenylpropionic acid transporter
LPLLDALTFAALQERSDAGQKVAPFHLIRVWGTIGFIVPGVFLFFLLRRGAGFDVVLLSTFAFCGLSALNALRLPPPAATPIDKETALKKRLSSSLPTAEAARALRRAPVLIFCVSLFLAGLGNAAFYSFFPLYVTDVVGLDKAYIAPISNVAVVFEIGFMLGCGWLLQRLGLKRLLLAGMIALVLRLLALALFPIPFVAVATQLVHGLIVISLGVAPSIYLNQQADDTYRNSIQGLYTMTVQGSSRILGSFLAGWVAKQSLPLLFIGSAALIAVAAALLLFAFHDELMSETK